MTDISANIKLFQELISCGNDIYIWCYDASGQLLHSNCPEESLLGTAFSLFGCKEQMLAHGAANGSPISLGTALGLIWGAAYEKENGELRRCYTIGPVFFSDISMQSIERGAAHYDNLEISLAWKHRFLDALTGMPVSHNIVFTRYLLMLHYCLTGEKLDASSLNISGGTERPQPVGEKRDRHKVWMAEQILLNAVRLGDLNYKQAFNSSVLISNGVPVKGADPLRQGKVSLIVFASIVCRAAIEGGLSPEEAYSLGDAYIQSIEQSANYNDLAAIAPIMYDDFVRRVHKRRLRPKLSLQIQKCCDYIETHLDEQIKASQLAELAGYTEYYLTRKFKEETGSFINDYVKAVKLTRAKELLTVSDLNIQEISDRLGFGTRSYFIKVFREAEGRTPVQYRANNKKH